jgi:hypothetical protein
MTSTHIEVFGAQQDKAPAGPLAIGGALSVLGAAGVVITSGFYVLSPPAAAGPVAPLDLAAAMSGAIRGAATLRAAGTVGIFGDLIWATAALLIAQALAQRGRGAAAAGWIALLLSILIFTFVDGMTGFVFPPLAAAGNASAFEGLKRLWDMLFLLGTAAYGAGVVAAMMGAALGEANGGGPGVNRILAGTLIVVGLIGGLDAVAGLLGVSGLPNDKIAGASIVLGAALFIPVSLQIARTPDRSPMTR